MSYSHRLPSTGLSTAHAERNINRLSTQLQDLENRVDSLSLICQAMWELLQERTNVTENMLIEKVNEIDLEDGKLDSKRSKPVTYCLECHRPLSKRHHRCLYCDRRHPLDSAFDSI